MVSMRDILLTFTVENFLENCLHISLAQFDLLLLLFISSDVLYLTTFGQASGSTKPKSGSLVSLNSHINSAIHSVTVRLDSEPAVRYLRQKNGAALYSTHALFNWSDVQPARTGLRRVAEYGLPALPAPTRESHLARLRRRSGVEAFT